MKKIIAVVLFIVASYILCIFALPGVAWSIWWILWLTSFNDSVIKTRDEFNTFVTSVDIMWKYKDTKDQALEIKQNVETQVNETKKQIEVIQTNVDKTAKAIDDTSKAIDNVIKTSSDLSNSIRDVVPKTSSGNIQK